MKRLITINLVLFIASQLTFAVPTDVWFEDGPQDPLLVPNLVHELGLSPPFPSGAAGTDEDEEIAANETTTDYRPCPENPDFLNIPNIEITMLNLTNTDWDAVWYVADEETLIQNYDGWVNQGLAFKIDRLGINRPLVNESINNNGIFEVGELWTFVIQDYQNPLFPASQFDSIGVGINSILTASSGSIIAIPEPATIALLGLGGLLLRRRKS